MMDNVPDSVDRALGDRIKTLRARQELTLDALAKKSGVSRAMISKIERGEVSATAVLLHRLCGGLGIQLSALFADERAPKSVLSRASRQPVWRDPATGYVRRDVAPPGTASTVEIVDVVFPPGARVAFKRPWSGRGDQHVWVLDGTLELTVGDTVHVLEAGDCLYMRLDNPLVYRNGGTKPVHYAVVLNHPEKIAT
jgi:transcriptional regulator with XRE-family HTH domain